jgi:hypothetical protein
MTSRRGRIGHEFERTTLMEKFAYTGSMNPVMKEHVERAVEAFLFENTVVDSDDCEVLAEQLVILVASFLAPNLVMKVVV